MIRRSLHLILLSLTTFGAAPAPTISVLLRGHYEAGGVPGMFTATVDPTTGHWRTDVVTGPLREESGFDGAPWLRHDGTTLAIDLPGPVSEARARVLILRGAWRDPALRRYVRRGPGTVVRVAAPGASAFTATLDAQSDAVTVQIDGDTGPLRLTFSDWRSFPGVGRVPLRREEIDADGQRTIFAAASATPVTAPALVRPASSRRDQLAASADPIPFDLLGGDRGHIVVPALIDGRDAKLVFDTGAANYLTPKVAAAYGLTVGGGLAIGGVGGGSFPGGYARIARLSIGPASLVDTVTMVAPLPDAATNPRPGLVLQGLTGGEFLTAFRTTIDYGRRRIGFAPLGSRSPGPDALPFRSDGIGLFVQASVEGHRGWFRLDTGDPGTVTLFRRFAHDTGLDRGGGPRRVSGGQVGGTLATRDRTFRQVRLGGLVLRDVAGKVSEQTQGAFASRTVAGNIGGGLLTGRTLVIDYNSRTVELLPVNGDARSAPAPGQPQSAAYLSGEIVDPLTAGRVIWNASSPLTGRDDVATVATSDLASGGETDTVELGGQAGTKEVL